MLIDALFLFSLASVLYVLFKALKEDFDRFFEMVFILGAISIIILIIYILIHFYQKYGA